MSNPQPKRTTPMLSPVKVVGENLPTLHIAGLWWYHSGNESDNNLIRTSKKWIHTQCHRPELGVWQCLRTTKRKLEVFGGDPPAPSTESAKILQELKNHQASLQILGYTMICRSPTMGSRNGPQVSDFEAHDLSPSAGLNL